MPLKYKNALKVYINALKIELSLNKIRLLSIIFKM